MIIRMKAKGVDVNLAGNKPGFTLPTNIGELGDDITELDLSNCSLTGTVVCPIIHAFVRFADIPPFCAGGVPKELGNLVNLTNLYLVNNQFRGELCVPAYMRCMFADILLVLQVTCPRSSATSSI